MEPEKLTWEDLTWFYEHHGLSIADISMVPGYENFEVCDGLPKDESLEFCEPDQALDDLLDYSCSIWARDEEE